MRMRTTLWLGVGIILLVAIPALYLVSQALTVTAGALGR